MRPLCPMCNGLLEDAEDETAPCMNATCLNSRRARELKPSAPARQTTSGLTVPGAGAPSRARRRELERKARKANRKRS